eukprot:CAMPEP_0176442190 /NCGR_PEP_ID=MMETSP0127-20121128/21662_1 /TAXON_ID=938130 /ORGANISM="Platyophrya macrostoma, Strain WH" /LENGTH=380 /DNA_ID=CAMNT_0017827145 /DNA_START=70 /DNA_END=1212 /DNA_ORIENTATION=+
MMDISRTAISQTQTATLFNPSRQKHSKSTKKSAITSPTQTAEKEFEKGVLGTSITQEKSSALGTYGRVDKYKILKEFSNKHANPVYLTQLEGQNSNSSSKSPLYVIKTLAPSDESFNNEVNIFSLPLHNNIIACKEILTSVSVEADSESKIQNAIVLEHAINGDLYPYLECGPLAEGICRYYFEQLLDAVEHLHSNGYCHLDIKPENILLDDRFNLKLTDFGYATAYSQTTGSKTVYSSCGTSAYYPPEAWKAAAKENGYDGTKADIFQLGILLFIMLTAQPPFLKSVVQDGWFALLARGRWDEFWDYKEKGLVSYSSVTERPVFSSELRDMLRTMLEPQPELRTTIENIRKSKWFIETFPAEPIEVQFEMMNRKAMKQL